MPAPETILSEDPISIPALAVTEWQYQLPSPGQGAAAPETQKTSMAHQFIIVLAQDKLSQKENIFKHKSVWKQRRRKLKTVHFPLGNIKKRIMEENIWSSAFLLNLP